MEGLRRVAVTFDANLPNPHHTPPSLRDHAMLFADKKLRLRSIEGAVEPTL